MVLPSCRPARVGIIDSDPSGHFDALNFALAVALAAVSSLTDTSRTMSAYGCEFNG